MDRINRMQDCRITVAEWWDFGESGVVRAMPWWAELELWRERT
jgi:hypothetical protein